MDDLLSKIKELNNGKDVTDDLITFIFILKNDLEYYKGCDALMADYASRLYKELQNKEK